MNLKSIATKLSPAALFVPVMAFAQTSTTTVDIASAVGAVDMSNTYTAIGKGVAIVLGIVAALFGVRRVVSLFGR
jgi:hypothetical protein